MKVVYVVCSRTQSSSSLVGGNVKTGDGYELFSGLSLYLYALWRF